MKYMEDKILEIVNYIRANKKQKALVELKNSDRLREDIGFTSFDLAELTVRLEEEFDIDIFEDGLVTTIGEIYIKLK